MIPRSTSYADRFSAADREQVVQLKEVYSEERSDILARSRRLQQETNRRRKALAVKRKLEAAKEEKRRQEILSRRRHEQREATDRFQRLGKTREQVFGYEEEPDYHHGNSFHPNKSSPSLQEALRAVTGKSSQIARQNSRETPVLEDALSAVRGSPNLYRSGSAKHQRSRSRQQIESENETDTRMDGSVNRGRASSGVDRSRPGSGYSQSTMGPDRIKEHAREVAARAELQSRSFRQTSSSKSLFEQQLEAQQLLLIQQQQQSLHHFNKAVQKEMETEARLADTERAEMAVKSTRSDSLSSVDSLEASSSATTTLNTPERTVIDKPEETLSHDKTNVSERHGANGGHISSQSPTYTGSAWGGISSVTGFSQQNSNFPQSTNSGGFFLHRSGSNVAVVSPSVIQGKTESSGQNKHADAQHAFDPGYFTPNKDFRTQYNNTVGNPVKPSTASASCTPMAHHNAIPVQNVTVNNVGSNSQHNDFTSSGKYTTPSSAYLPVSTQSPSTHGNYSTIHTSSATAVVSHGFGPMAYLPHPPNTSAPSSRNPVTMSDMRAGGLSGNVKDYGRKEEVEEIYPEEDTTEGKTVQTRKAGQKTAPKGILKKTRVGVGRGGARGMRVHSATSYTSRLRAQNRARSAATAGPAAAPPPSTAATTRPSSSSSLRDSIEVTREQLSSRQQYEPQKNSRHDSSFQKVKKRSIRWADINYSDEEEDEEQELQKSLKEYTNKNIQNLKHHQDPIINTQSKIPTAQNAERQRPFSANYTSSTAPVESVVRESRAPSAGARKQPFLHPSIRNSVAANKAQNNNSHTTPDAIHRKSDKSSPSYPKPNNEHNRDHLSSSVTAADVRKSLEGAVYDSNGIRLDRTPTDDEINWLWDKVRTCLSRQSTMDTAADEHHNTERTAPRQAAQVTSKYIDGTSLNPQLRTAPPTRAFGTQNGYNGLMTAENSTFGTTYPRKKPISMETLNTYNRRAYSATHQRSPATNSAFVHGNSNQALPFSAYQSGASTLRQGPGQSNTSPYQSPSQVNGNNEVTTDSMAEFLAAEEMAAAKSGSISDSQLQTALQQRRRVSSAPVHHQRRAMSALSIEEQRLLESLERLDERLKAVEKQNFGKQTGSSSAVYVPRPPPHRPGFRGCLPLQRRYVGSAGTVRRRRYRVPSNTATKATVLQYH